MTEKWNEMDRSESKHKKWRQNPQNGKNAIWKDIYNAIIDVIQSSLPHHSFIHSFKVMLQINVAIILCSIYCTVPVYMTRVVVVLFPAQQIHKNIYYKDGISSIKFIVMMMINNLSINIKGSSLWYTYTSI